MKNRLFRALSKIVFVSIIIFSNAHATEIPPVPQDHPRVYLRPSDLPAIKAKLTQPEFNTAWQAVQQSDHMLCRAFVYLTQNDRQAGREAITTWLSYIHEVKDNHNREGRHWDNVMHLGACIYDWCYDLLTETEKITFITELQRVADSHSPGYPAQNTDRSHAVVGHDTEGWLLAGQLPAGIAIYNESPQMYDAAAALFFERFVPARNFLYKAHMHHQGDSYIVSRFQHDISAAWLFRRLGAGHVFSQEQQYITYQIIYNMRPDIKQMVSGDTFDDRGNRWNKRMLHMLTGTYYQDPYLIWLADSDIYRNANSDHIVPPYVRVFELLFREPNLPKTPISQLPTTKYFAEPMGDMVARTGWNLGVDSDDAVITMRIGNTFFGNHQAKDFGTFQIYYKGALALSTGVYKDYGSAHWKNYYHQTIAKNGLLILDPSEQMAKEATNDGGQRWPDGTDHPRNVEMLQEPDYQMGRVTAHAFGPNTQTPAYSYVSGNITNAYAAQKVSKVTRSMVTFNTHNETYPAIFVVFDRVVSKDPTFKKTWLLHAIQEPTIENRTVTLTRNEEAYMGGQYNGKLVATSLLPETVTLTKVGGTGREFSVNGVNYLPQEIDPDTEPGAWRVEISPTNTDTAHTFLHAMTVMNATTTTAPQITKTETAQMIGATVLNQSVFFGRTDTLLTSVTLEIPNTQNVLLCDLASGVWSIQKNGQEIQQITVTAPGYNAYIKLEKGTYQLKRVTLQDDADASSSDFDKNGFIDFADFLFFATTFGAQQTDTRFQTQCDLDNSGYIGFTDFILFAAAFGQKIIT